MYPTPVIIATNRFTCTFSCFTVRTLGLEGSQALLPPEWQESFYKDV